MNNWCIWQHTGQTLEWWTIMCKIVCFNHLCLGISLKNYFVYWYVLKKMVHVFSLLWWNIRCFWQNMGMKYVKLKSYHAKVMFLNILAKWTWSLNLCLLYRKYKDDVYRKMLVQEYLKKWRIFKRVKPKNDMMYHDIYNCICQNTKKIRFIIHYVKPTAQLLFRIRFPKGGPTCRRQVVNPRHQTSQGQSVAKPETPLQNIQVE